MGKGNQSAAAEVELVNRCRFFVGRLCLLTLSGEVPGVLSWSLVRIDAPGRDDFRGAAGAQSDLPAVGGRVVAGLDDAVVVG
ncbi:MAG: hypothetical protein VB080_08625, partial [Propionicimonas sp.]|uniref:hypothetical protein n=1 Tax=Propionicimonas sp. TaxID=1955623 RepID=UPI002B1E99CC